MACAPADSKSPVVSASTQTQPIDSIPLIVLRSFFNNHEFISSKELREGLTKGVISCTADIAQRVGKSMGIEEGLVIKNVSDFPLTDTSAFILTSIDSVVPQLLVCAVDSVHFFRDHLNYPAWIPDSAAHPWESLIQSYTHTGVTALTRRTGVVLNTMTNEKYLELILPFIGNPDLLHISNEVSMQPNCDYASMKMKFATRPEHFEIFNLLGADIIELTGNHNLDVGKEPYVSSFKWFGSQGMKTFGGGLTPQEASAPLQLSVNDGKQVAWIGFNEFCPCGECADVAMGANRYKEDSAKNAIEALGREVDYIIACVQFGETDSYTPTASQKKIAKALIDAGADVVIGSQAHQPQTFELYHDKLIFYGIGNFMFDQIHRVGVRQAYFLECYFYKGAIIQFIPRFTYMGDDRRPSPATNAQIEAIKKAVYLPNFFIGN